MPLDPKIADAAYSALKTAGLLHDDRDLAKLFDVSAITIRSDGPVLVPPSFVNAAKRAHPDWFFDAMNAPMDEINRRVKTMAQEHARQRIAAEQSAFLVTLSKTYAGP